MTYRERRGRKAANLREWADKRETVATATLQRDREVGSDWAFITQSGRIPERDRMNARADRAYESLNRAKSMDSRAAGIEQQLDGAIYSDDPDAKERLAERIAELTTKRDTMKARNAEYRKSHRAELAALTPYARDCAMPHAGWEISNLTANIARNRERLAALNAPYRPRTIYARFAGECPDCSQPIVKDTQITEIEPNEWVHLNCAIARQKAAQEQRSEDESNYQVDVDRAVERYR